jgi:hypothetical protein
VPADVGAFRLPGNDQNVQHQIGAASGGRVLPASSAAELATAFAVAAETFTDSAAVRVDVPANLAGTQAVISVSAAAGKYRRGPCRIGSRLCRATGCWALRRRRRRKSIATACRYCKDPASA